MARRTFLTPYANAQIEKRAAQRTWMREALASKRGRPPGVTEVKYIDIAGANYVNDTTGSIKHIDIVPQGTLVTERQGKRWQNTRFEIKAFVQGGTTGTVAKWANILVWDKTPLLNLPTISTILHTVDSNSLIEKDYEDRFKIIKRWQGTVIGTRTDAANSEAMKSFEASIKLPAYCKANCVQNDITGVIANRMEGALYLVSVGSVAAGAGAALTTATMRLHFIDY